MTIWPVFYNPDVVFKIRVIRPLQLSRTSLVIYFIECSTSLLACAAGEAKRAKKKRDRTRKIFKTPKKEFKKSFRKFIPLGIHKRIDFRSFQKQEVFVGADRFEFK